MKTAQALCILVVSALVGFVAPSAFADDIDELVEARQDNFKILGKNAKSLRKAFGGGEPDWRAIGASVAKMQQANTKVLDFFPPESAETFITTEAKPDIWDDFDDFTARQNTLTERLDAFAQAVARKDASASAKAFRSVGKACKNCHDKYKEE